MEWIAIKDEQPPEQTDVIVYAPDGFNQVKELVKQAYHMAGSFTVGYYNNRIDGVTHWMPMPKAPNRELCGGA